MQNGASRVKRVEVAVLFVRIWMHLGSQLKSDFACTSHIKHTGANKSLPVLGKTKLGYVTHSPLFFRVKWLKIKRLQKQRGIKP